MITVLIATKNRPTQLARCLLSLQKSRNIKFEIILADQGNINITKNILLKFPSLSITHLNVSHGGKGTALNEGLKLAKGSIVALTDDDCVVDKFWLSKIEQYLQSHSGIAGLFGKTLPYKPQSHKGLVCLTVFTKNKPFITSDPHTVHFKELGIGNNMIFRRSVFNKIGGFKEWLGVGSVSQAGGIEGEFIYRALINKFVLAYQPTITVYHDKWLTKKQEELLQTKYLIGTVAFCWYYILRSKDIRLIRNFLDLRIHITHHITILLNEVMHRKNPKETLYFIYLNTLSFLRGILLGVSHAVKE